MAPRSRRPQPDPGTWNDSAGRAGKRRDPLDLVRLREVMALTGGRPDVVIGLVDGPVEDHPALDTGSVRTVGTVRGCRVAGSPACMHGTFVAGILAARRSSEAPAIAPDCTLLVRALVPESTAPGSVPSASQGQLAEAIVDCVDAGARLVNLSVALTGSAFGVDRALAEGLEHARRRGVLVIAAAGNGGKVGGSTLTRHPWVLPVVAYSSSGRPLAPSDLGRAIGRGGLGGPGEGVTSLSPHGRSAASAAGTSVATPFVTGTAALLWSLHPAAGPAEVKRALLASGGARRKTIVPPLLNAWLAHQLLSRGPTRRAVP